MPAQSIQKSAIKPISKIIYVINLPLTISNEKVFYIKELIQAGISVEYWDITALFFNATLVDKIERTYATIIESYEALSQKLRLNDSDSTLYVVQITYEYRSLKLYRLLRRSACRIAQFDRPGFPMDSQWQLRSSVLTKLICIKKYPLYLAKIRNIFYQKIAPKHPFEIIFAAGMHAVSRNESSANIVCVNHFDYDNYLESDASITRLVDCEYCVFLDEYLPYHSDFLLYGIQTVEPDSYFASMNALFKRIEDQYGIQVVIASHPKSDYLKNPFNNRPIFKYKTKELVKFASLVVVHASTSNSFALIYQKPVLFVYTTRFEEIFRRSLFALMKDISNRLGARLMNVDEPLDEWSVVESSVDTTKYECFLDQYLTTQMSKHRHTSSILIDFVRTQSYRD